MASARRVSSDELGDDWPLTVPEATIRRRGDALLLDVAGTIYGLNGTAKGLGHPAIPPDVWAEHPEYAPNRRSLHPLIVMGEQLEAGGRA